MLSRWWIYLTLWVQRLIVGTEAPIVMLDGVHFSFLSFLDIPWEVLRSVSTLAQSVISFAVVAILATSAPAAHIASRVVSRALSVGVLWKLCEDRMIFVSMGTAPPPVTYQSDMTVGLQCQGKKAQAGCISTSLFPNKTSGGVMRRETTRYVKPCSTCKGSVDMLSFNWTRLFARQL